VTPRHRRAGRWTGPGRSQSRSGLCGLLFAVIQAATAGWGSAEVIIGLVVAVVFVALFLVIEHRTRSPLLRLELFASRAFAITAVVTVVGMFSFLGTAYASSIRLSAIQGFSPLKTSLAFVLLQGFTLVMLPLNSRLLPRVNPRWRLGRSAARRPTRTRPSRVLAISLWLPGDRGHVAA
jgi:hypothetical protein